jgi:DNA-binding CsgD family transcriptional regulator
VDRCHFIVGPGREDWRGLAGHVDLAEAVVLAAEGRLDEATVLFESSVATMRRYGVPWDEAEALRAWALALARAADYVRSRDLLAAAADVYRRIGAGQPWIDRVDAESRILGASPGRGQRNPDGLTDREVEVLHLLAGGRTNQEIADALVLSVKTVERHLANIYTKVNLRGRVEATLYAVKHGLG